MPKKDNRTMPEMYPVCVLADCPLDAQCLRRTAYKLQTPTVKKCLSAMNPERCTKDEICPFFVNNEPVRFARGFKGMRAKMYPGQYDQFQRILIAHFGRNPFYERQRGDYGLPPNEQELVRKALRKVGVDDTLEFDSYEMQPNWEE